MVRIKGRRYLFGVILSIHVASKYLEIISFLGVFSLWRFLRARIIRYVIQFWSCLLIACIVVYPVILSLQALVKKMAQLDDWTEA